VKLDNLLFVSGQVGSRADGSPEPNFEAQVRLAFANLEGRDKRVVREKVFQNSLNIEFLLQGIN
jgi:enamine deaminase RidA (YjgF/YER057c/UK114 family)